MSPLPSQASTWPLAHKPQESEESKRPELGPNSAQITCFVKVDKTSAQVKIESASPIGGLDALVAQLDRARLS